ncbi:MAG: riboflavin synthase [Acidobacteria bacterium]|nr:riboflavin synthase [Acidobacteriota bacterium]
MFTGLVEAVGRVAEVKGTGSGWRLRVRTELASELRAGDSLAVDGVCLTVILADGDQVHADIGPETARVTTLGSLRPDQLVNLERPLRADGRVGGHFMLGHVDGTGTVDDVRAEGDAHWLTMAFERTLAPYLVRKGSIAVDGISLTVAGLGDARFDVMIVPHTWEHTNLRVRRVGDRVNLECDVVGKYVARAMELAEAAGAHAPALHTKV